MNDSASDAHDDDASAAAEERPLQQVRPFHPGWLAWELRRDTAVRLVAVIAAIAAMLVLATAGMGGSVGAGVVAVLVLVGWMALSMSSARVTRELPRVTALIGTAPEQAEDQLATLLSRWGLLRSVRVLLVHRLAMLRHRQERFDEVAVITSALAGQSLGLARDIRPHVLLMHVEAKVERGDVWGAWYGLMDLYRTRLTLVEALQRMALQTRYELAIGRSDAVLRSVEHKVQLAELLPTPQAGSVHALLATAARQRHQHDLATWLWDRTKLLCTAEQLDQLAAGRFGARVADAVDDAVLHPAAEPA